MAMLRLGGLPLKIPGLLPGTFVFHNNDGYIYQKNRITENGSVYFKCAKYERRLCHGRAIYHLGTGFVSKGNTHDHAPDPYEADERVVRRKILDRCATAEYVSFSKIVSQERRPYHLEVQKRISLARMRPAMQRVRRSLYPAPPENLAALAEILRDNRLITMTKDGRDNIYGASVTAADGSQSIIFTSRRVMQYAAVNCQWLFGDGTFQSLPAIPSFTAASQVFTIVGNWDHNILPLATVLMERRTELAYDAVLQTIKAFMRGGENVTNVVTDFEVAQQNSWTSTFPHAQLQGCFFHVVRAFVRYAKEELHLAVHLRAPDGPVRKFVRLCCAIPLLPRRWLFRGLGVVMREARQEGNRTYRLLRPFFEYILINWINQRQRSNLMSVYGSLHRTNNTCESHHRQLNKYIQVAHPNVYDFIEAIVSIEESTWINSQALLDGIAVCRSRKATSIANDRRLLRLARDLRAPRGLVGAPMDDRILRYLNAAAYTFARAYDNAIQNE